MPRSPHRRHPRLVGFARGVGGPTLSGMAAPSQRAIRAAIEQLCASGPVDTRDFRAVVLATLRRTVDFDWYVWVLTDPAGEVGVDPLAVVPDLTALPELVRLKYGTRLNRWTGPVVAAALGDRRDDSPLWVRAQSDHGVADVVSVVFRDGFGCWAFLDLWCRHRVPDDAVRLLGELAPALTTALRRRQAGCFAEPAGLRPGASDAAVLLLDRELRIVGRTPTSQAWLALLLPPGDRPDPVPAAALNIAAQLIAREDGADDHPAVGRVHLAAGFWLTMKAARVTPGDLIAVTMEASSPADRLDLFARCHGLSRREQELLDELARGASTREIADRMFLSEHTVQDHLKSIFGKTGAHARRTLLSRALGVRTDVGPA